MNFTAEWFVIVNQAADYGRSLRDWRHIEHMLHTTGMSFEASLTQHKYHAVELTVAAVNSGVRKIIIVGGDATLHEVVNGLFIQKAVSPDEVIIGIIPAASVHRHSGMKAIPSSYPEAIQTIASGYFSMYEVLKTAFYKANYKQERHFIISARIGLDANIVKRMVRLRENGSYGKLHQWLAAIRQIIKYRTSKIKIGVDGHYTTLHTFTSGFIHSSQDAVNGKGPMEIRAISSVNKLRLILSILKLRSGKFYDTRSTVQLSGDSIVINSNTTITLSADGEMLGYSPLEFSRAEKRIRIIVPRHTASFTPEGIAILR